MSTIRIGKSFVGGAANQTFNGNTDFATVNYAQATGGITADLSKGIVTREFTPSVKDPFKILPVGDSITYGFINTEIPDQPQDNNTGGYRNFLDQFLIADGLGASVNFVGSQETGSFSDNEHEGHSGKTTSFISSRIKGWLNAQQPDMVLLMIGTNDTRSDANPSQADERLSALIDKITSHSPTTHVLVASIPPIDASVRKTQSENAEIYNSKIPGIVEEKVAAGKKVSFVDINSLLSVDDIFDGVHPSLEGYEKIAEGWYDWIKSSRDALNDIDNIIGTAYDDTLKGNSSSNIIQGGAGNDLIIGLAGDDLLGGGKGKDTFVLALGDGTDTITDFSVSEDFLQLSGSLTFEQLSIAQGSDNYNNDTWITHKDSGERLALLLGVNAEALKDVYGTPDILLINIDDTPIAYTVEAYGGASQNPEITSTVSNDSKELRLEGNGWRKLNLDGYQVNADTLLRFEFNSNDVGEIQGIGFDNNDNIRGTDDAKYFFQVDGSDNWGITNLDKYIVSSVDGFDQYSIPVGQFFTGTFEFLTVANDYDVSNPNAIGVFKNIELLETVTPPSNSETSLDISIDGVIQSKQVEAYGGSSQNPDITSTISSDNKELRLEGNGWRRLDISAYQLDTDTNLNFEFKSNGSGEVQGIGFDNNNKINSADDAGHFFQVDGNQSWGIENLDQYIIGQSDGFDRYSIPVGNLFVGQFDYLTIGNDHDVSNPNSISEFRNIELT